MDSRDVDAIADHRPRVWFNVILTEVGLGRNNFSFTYLGPGTLFYFFGRFCLFLSRPSVGLCGHNFEIFDESTRQGAGASGAGCRCRPVPGFRTKSTKKNRHEKPFGHEIRCHKQYSWQYCTWKWHQDNCWILSIFHQISQ